MKFECDSCNAQYMIADEKVGQRGVKVKCKRCSHIIIVRPLSSDETGVEATAPEQPAMAASQGKEPELPAPPAPAIDEGASGGSDEAGTDEHFPPLQEDTELAAGPSGDASDETQVAPRPRGLSDLNLPSMPSDEHDDETELGGAPPDVSGEQGASDDHLRVSGEEDLPPPPPPEMSLGGGGLDDLPPLPSDVGEPAMPPVEPPPDGPDALDEQLAGAFSNMFDDSAAADIPAPPPMSDEADERGSTVVLDLGQVEKLRRESARTELGAPLADPAFDEAFGALGGAGEVTGPSPWSDAGASHSGAGAASEEPEWHVAIDDEDVGPLSLDDIASHIAAGRVDRESLVWRAGMGDWDPADEVPEIRALFDRVPLPRIAAPPEPASSSLGGFDVGAPVDDLAPSPFGGPGRSDPFGDVPDMGTDPSWQPHGLTDVYQAANLAEAAAGIAASSPARSAPSLGAPAEEEPVEWKPGAASALASLVQDEIKRIDAAPSADDVPVPADDGGLGGFGDAVGSGDLPSASAGGLDLGGLPPLSGVDLPGPQLPAASNGHGMAYAPAMSGAGLPAMSGAGLPAMSGAGLPAMSGAAMPAMGGMAPLPYAPVPPPSRPMGVYVAIGAVIAIPLLILTIALVKLAFFGSTPTPAVTEAPPQATAPAAAPAPNPAAVAAATPQPAAPGVVPAASEPAAAAPPTPAGDPATATPQTPEPRPEPVKVASAAPRREDKPKAKEPARETRLGRAAKKDDDEPRRKSRASEERKSRKSRAPSVEEEDKPKSRGRKDCDPVLDFDCDEKPSRSSRASRSSSSKETLSPSDVLVVVRKNIGSINRCGKRHNTSATVKMEWRIAKSGRTTGVKVLTSKYAGTPVGKCLTNEIKSWRFPSYSGKAPPPVKFPFKLD